MAKSGRGDLVRTERILSVKSNIGGMRFSAFVQLSKVLFVPKIMYRERRAVCA